LHEGSWFQDIFKRKRKSVEVQRRFGCVVLAQVDRSCLKPTSGVGRTMQKKLVAQKIQGQMRHKAHRAEARQRLPATHRQVLYETEMKM
jgi:hypothetical protein